MQIIRTDHLNLQFPSTSPQPNAGSPVPLVAPALKAAPSAPVAPLAPPAPPASGVIYTGSGNATSPDLDAEFADLDNMSLENQLAYGRNKGVFTKITLSKDGVLVARPLGDTGAKSRDFAASAAATMKDFEEGIASLKKHSADVGDRANHSLAGKFKSLQQLTAKLNVFA